MPTTKRDSPYCWVTWLTPLLSGDSQCEWAAWLQSRFTITKVKRDFDSAAWAAQHNDMLNKRVSQLTADGWLCFLEDQNGFNLRGERVTLAGKPDIVAVRDDVAKVIDCKTGKRKDGDYQQVLIYLLVLPLTLDAIKGKRLVGELQYKDGSVDILPEELTPDVKERIVAMIRKMGEASPARRVPSFRECMFCPVSSADCPDRIEKKQTATAGGMF